MTHACVWAVLSLFPPCEDMGGGHLQAGKRALSRSWPCGPCRGPSSLHNGEKINLFQLPSWRCPNMATPRQQIRPPTQAKMTFLVFTHTTGRHRSDSTQGCFARPQLRTWAAYQTAWAPHTQSQFIPTIDVKADLMFLISTMEKQMGGGRSAVFNTNLDTSPKLGVRWPSNGGANLTRAHEHVESQDCQGIKQPR